MQTTVINWNALQDPFDLEIWNKLVSQFWIDTKIPLSNDLKSWSEMTEAEKLTTKKVFVGLTALDSIQSLVGAPTLQKYALTDHEEHVLNNIAFMESVHAKSYSSIFSTLCSNTEIAEMYAWGDANNALQTKGRMIEEAYHSGDIHKIRIASTLLESFLFYSGFFWPLYLSGRKKLTNTSDLIKLIIRDEGIHGLYIGYKHKQAQRKLSQRMQNEYKQFTHDLLYELLDNEMVYTRELYDELNLTSEVATFLKYNANKALENLGYEHIYKPEETRVMPSVMAVLSPGGDNHDFFSGAGSSYQVAKKVTLSDDDFDY